MVELGIFLAAMIALVVCGCMATRLRKRRLNTGPVKDCIPPGEGAADCAAGAIPAALFFCPKGSSKSVFGRSLI